MKILQPINNLYIQDKLDKIIVVILLFIAQINFSQNTQDRQTIIKEYDLTELNQIEQASSRSFYLQKNKARLLANKKSWKLKYTDPKGSKYELMSVSKEGKPIYYKTFNQEAAISTRANYLHKDGGLGLNLEGQGMTAHVWDEGIARATHQEYDGKGGVDRFSVGDGSTELDFHGAHVMGTIIASGVDPLAKGMAPQAKGIGYDWSNDTGEATAAAANGMLLSNHSYGFAVRDQSGDPALPAYFFGGYTSYARDWDLIMYNAPYYLMVASAGNDGNDNTANEAPLEGNNSYDKLTGDKVSKNSLIVANGQDAVINADGVLISMTINSSSSEGPTDDLRIKPDITGNGTALYSTYDNSDSAYNSLSGTSMSSPNITGSLLLLQQHHNETYGSFMRASTLKGLALHTADDTGVKGPDAVTGWGLMNAKKAVETITKKGIQSIISEVELTQGSTYSIAVKSDGLEPLLASISWTDIPGTANTGTANDPTPVLVNDLDIRVVKNTETSSTFMPWKLTSVDTNEQEDNNVDPFERVDVDNASGEYIITISHKGTLEGGSQKVSLIVTGVSSGIALLTNTNSKISCNDTEEFNFNFIETIGGTTSFSVDGLPSNATVDLSNNSLSDDGNLSVTFGNLNNVAPGSYKININGQNGTETTTAPIVLRIISEFFLENKTLPIFPSNGLSGVSSIGASLRWENDINAENYQIEVSENPSFETILFSKTESNSSISLQALKSEAVYYWRVKPENSCGSGEFSPVYSFQTGISDCSKVYDATDFSMATIATTPNLEDLFVPINVTDNLIIDKVLVTTDISHTYVADMTISLEGPSFPGVGSTKVVLISNKCEGGDDVNATFDDASDLLSCSNSTPVISGSVAPSNNMSSSYAGKDAFGEWKLIVNDPYNDDGGQINSASIRVCTLETNTNIPSLINSEITVDKNTTHTITNDEVKGTTVSELSNIKYTLITIPSKGSIRNQGVDLSVGDEFDQNQIRRGFITYNNSQTSSFSDEFKVDLTSAMKGWLPNQTIHIKERTLTLEDNSLQGFRLWPNPTNNVFKIQFTNSDTNNVNIGLYDLQGRQILNTFKESKANIFTEEINIQNIASGIYLLTIQQGNKRITKKVMVSR
jgi:subtilisin-like proprotein convertase family protein